MRKSRLLTVTLVVVLAAVVLPALASAQTGGVVFIKNNRFGLGTSDPAVLFHAKVTSGSLPLRLERPGSTWAFLINTFNEFSVNKVGSGGQEFTVRDRLDASPLGSTMKVDGSIDATAFNVTSSRTLKTDFEPVDSRQMLARLVALPVTEWKFKSDIHGRRHIGPMAEDFQSLFAVGDGHHIALNDSTGVTIAAIQGLHGELQDRDQKIADLRQKIDELERVVLELAAER